ncbi:hypothetical protein HK102_009079, partial [Quaeritorhiza haematococci]
MISMQDDGFKVIPSAKWYKFNPKIAYQTLTLEEAEAELATRSRGLKAHDRWLMHKRRKEGLDEEEMKGVKGEDGAPKRRGLRITDDLFGDDDSAASKKRRRIRNQELEEELDYDVEQEFQDDDGLMDLGLEDEEEAKDAERRTFGKAAKKANFDDDDFDDLFEEETSITGTGKQIKKSLRKIEKNAMYESDEENPYASEEEEEEEEEVKKEDDKDKVTPGLEDLKGKKRKESEPSDASASTTATANKKLKKERSVTPPETASPSTMRKSPTPPGAAVKREGSPVPPGVKRERSSSPYPPPGRASSPGVAGAARGRSQSPVGAGAGAAAGAAKVSMKTNASPSPPPVGKRKREASPDYGETKKIKLRVTSGSVSPNAPPPPTAAEVIKKLHGGAGVGGAGAKSRTQSASPPPPGAVGGSKPSTPAGAGTGARPGTPSAGGTGTPKTAAGADADK